MDFFIIFYNDFFFTNSSSVDTFENKENIKMIYNNYFTTKDQYMIKSGNIFMYFFFCSNVMYVYGSFNNNQVFAKYYLDNIEKALSSEFIKKSSKFF